MFPLSPGKTGFIQMRWSRLQPSPCLLYQPQENSAPSPPCPLLWVTRASVIWMHLNASKVMLKILQARLQQYVNPELPDAQAGFRKGRGTKDQIANIFWIMEKAREFQKNIYFCFIDMPKPLTMWIRINCGKFFKTWKYQATWPASWEIYMQVRKQQLELDIDQQTGSK